jgi:DNA-binding IclR family transcriptional regulator
VQDALHARIGEHLPIHAGGSSKALFAFLPEAERQRIYSRPLTQYNERTIFEPEALEDELARVREQGWARDPGEFTASVNSYAAPIRDRSGDVVAAVSIPFLSGRDAEYEQLVRATALATADRISVELS